MNWKNYFDLQDARKKWFKRYFFILLLIYFVFFWKGITGGANYACPKLCPISEDDSILTGDNGLNVTLNLSELDNGTNGSKAVNNLVNVSKNIMENNTNTSGSLIKRYLTVAIANAIKPIVSFNATKFYENHIWIKCSTCRVDDFDLIYPRVAYGPLVVVPLLILSLIFSYVWYARKYNSIENPKKEDEEKQEKKK